MDILDTRDLAERLDELEDLNSAEADAREMMEESKIQLEVKKLNLEFHEKRLDDSRDTDSGVEIEGVEADTDAAEREFDTAETEFDDCESDLQDAIMDDSDRSELNELLALKEEISGWKDGVTLIPVDDFESYCQDLCEDIGDIPKNLPDYIVIDWDATSNNLKADYSEIDYNGETYLYRPE